MRPRHAILALALVAGLTACGSSSNKTSSDNQTTNTPVSTPTVTPPTTAGHLDCAKYASTSAQISAAASKMMTGSAADFETAMNSLKAELSALKDGAPSDVKTAVDELTSALTDMAKFRTNPSATDQAHLQSLAAKLPADAQKIGAYIAVTCHG